MIYFDNPLKILDKYGPWLYLPNFFTKDECNKIVEEMKSFHDAKVSTSAEQNVSLRSAKIHPLEMCNRTKWIFERLEDVIRANNSEIYKFDILGILEAIQLIRYQPGDHYDWHQDFSGGIHSTRKLSVSVQLSPESDYEGGELEFFRFGKAPKTQGTLIMFPSFIEHKVHPLESGTRNALVAWVNGHPFR